MVQRGLTIGGARWALTATTGGNWQPLTWLSHMLDRQLFGGDPAGHHLTSVVLHVANAVVLLVVLWRATGRLWPSAVVAALFGVHPLHVESVAWIAERKDVLSTLWFLLGLWAYVEWAQRGGGVRWAAVAACLVLGLAAKPMLVTFPVVLLLLDVWPLGRIDGAPESVATASVRTTSPRGAIVEKLPLVALAFAVGVVTIVAQQAAGGTRSTIAFPMPLRFANAAVAYVAYLRKMLWPSDLAIYYPYPTAVEPGRVAVAAVVLIALSTLAWTSRRRAPYVLVGWLWYVVTLAPVIGIIQVGHQSMADRYTYVPLIGIFVAVVFGADALARGLAVAPRIPAAAAAAVLVACVVATRVELGHWRTSIALFTHALEVTHDNYMAHQGLGDALAGTGRRAEAEVHFREAARLAPTLVEAHLGLGDALMEDGDVAGAIGAYRHAVALRPDAEAHVKLGNALWRSGALAAASDEFEEAVRLAPDDAQNVSNAGAVLYALGRRDEAIGRFAAAVRLDPSNAAAHGNLGLLLVQSGKRDEGAREIEEALRLQPDNADAHYNLANLLLADGRNAEAATHYERALAGAPDDPATHNNLGIALERLGRLDEARAHFHEALRLQPDFETAAANAARLDAATR